MIHTVGTSLRIKYDRTEANTGVSILIVVVTTGGNLEEDSAYVIAGMAVEISANPIRGKDMISSSKFRSAVERKNEDITLPTKQATKATLNALGCLFFSVAVL